MYSAVIASRKAVKDRDLTPQESNGAGMVKLTSTASNRQYLR
jgi:hypothetical protein